MRIAFILFTLVLLLPLSMADVSLSCSSDSDCALYGFHSCVDSMCVLEKGKQEIDVRYTFSFKESVEWKFSIVEENPSLGSCEGDGCLYFAPPNENKILNFLFYAQRV